MKKWMIAIIVLSAGIFACAETVSFTSAEGYSAGELNLNPEWTGSTGFPVDPSGSGSVTNVGASAWKNISYTGGSQSVSGTIYSASSLFTFEGTDSSSQAGLRTIYALNFMDSAQKLQLLFRRRAGGAFDIGFYENSGSVDASANTVDFASADLGLSGTLSTSDQLRLVLTITRGTDETDWTYGCLLENMDTSDTVSSLTGTFESSASFFTNDVTAGMSTTFAASDSEISPLTIQEFSVMTLDPGTVGFTSMEGYGGGELALNSGWTGSAGANFLVNPFDSGSVINVGAAGWKNMQYNAGAQSVSGATYTVSSTFTFEGTDSTSQTVDKTVYKATFVDGATKLEGLFRRLKTGGFDVGFFENSGSVHGSGNGVDVAAADLGLGATLSESDRMRILLTITRGTDETDWAFNARLENLDTATTLSTTSGTFESSVSFFTNDVIPGMSSASAVAEAELSPLTIQEFSVLTVDSDAVGFTSAEGYSSGDLTLNSGWTGPASFMVDPFDSGSVTNVGALGFKNLSYIGGTQSVSGTAYTVSSLFTFEGTDTSAQTIDKSLYMVTFVDGAKRVPLMFRRLKNGGNFDVAIYETSGSVVESANGVDVSPALLGLGSTLSVSDQLRLSLTITRGTDETDWSYSGTLENVDTDAVLSSVSGTFESSVAFFTGDVVPGMSSASAASEAELSPFTVQEFNVDFVPMEIPDEPVVVVTVIGAPEQVGPNLLKVVVRSNGSWEDLRLVESSDLVTDGWSYVAHSDDGVNAFVVTNLSYATAVDATNRAVYVQTTHSAAFFGIE